MLSELRVHPGDRLCILVVRTLVLPLHRFAVINMSKFSLSVEVTVKFLQTFTGKAVFTTELLQLNSYPLACEFHITALDERPVSLFENHDPTTCHAYR